MNNILTRCFFFISANISFKTEACSCKYSITRNSLQFNFEFKKPPKNKRNMQATKIWEMIKLRISFHMIFKAGKIVYKTSTDDNLE